MGCEWTYDGDPPADLAHRTTGHVVRMRRGELRQTYACKESEQNIDRAIQANTHVELQVEPVQQGPKKREVANLQGDQRRYVER